MSRFDKFTVPGLQGDQCIHDPRLMVLGHVLMHVGVVLPDVALRAAVGDRPEAERRGVRVRTLELEGKKRQLKLGRKEVRGGDREGNEAQKMSMTDASIEVV